MNMAEAKNLVKVRLRGELRRREPMARREYADCEIGPASTTTNVGDDGGESRRLETAGDAKRIHGGSQQQLDRRDSHRGEVPRLLGRHVGRDWHSGGPLAEHG
jgi:hypothetical protein